VDVVRVEVLELGLGDLAHLVRGDLRDLDGVRRGRALLDARGLLDELRGRRGLRHEGEGAVLVDRDLHRDDVAALRLGRRVVGLAELHDVHAVLTERGADRRGGRRRTGLDLELDEAGDLLLGRHDSSLTFFSWADAVGDDPVAVLRSRAHGRCRAARQILATWLNDSSTGVSRPKMETRTLSFWFSTLISGIAGGSVANGPSVTVTDSPTVKSTSTGAFAAAWAGLPGSGAGASIGASIEKTSSSVSGTGWWVWPTNPVTPGVWRTAPHDSSVRSMRTRT